MIWIWKLFITGPPTHSVGGQTSRPNGRGRLSSSSVTLHGGPAGNSQARTSCGLQSNYSFTGCTAGQLRYVPLGRHRVETSNVHPLVNTSVSVSVTVQSRSINPSVFVPMPSTAISALCDCIFQVSSKCVQGLMSNLCRTR